MGIPAKRVVLRTTNDVPLGILSVIWHTAYTIFIIVFLLAKKAPC